MGLIRLIILAVVIWLIWRMIKNYQVKQARRQKKKQVNRDKIVKCSFCSVHVPMHDAIQQQDEYFCSAEHRDKYLTR